ncbi:MAG: 6-hydroxymethylpterin diphosphokinase MptE-like protein [Candidatus Hydrothermarchaeales archaeon]
MRFEEWEGVYREILSEFDFSEEGDKAAASLFNSIIKPLDNGLLKEKITGKRVNIYGAGPSLELIERFASGTNIAADGATSYLLKRGVVPDIVVTDLDGRIEDLRKAKKEGSIMVVHAHGDNINAIRKHVRHLGRIVGTTQTRPFGNLNNFGGFTDGDRAVFLAHHFGAKEIHLYGMDFHGEIGKYSFTNDAELKARKLKWAEKLIKRLIEKGVKVVYEDEAKA